MEARSFAYCSVVDLQVPKQISVGLVPTGSQLKATIAGQRVKMSPSHPTNRRRGLVGRLGDGSLGTSVYVVAITERCRKSIYLKLQ